MAVGSSSSSQSLVDPWDQPNIQSTSRSRTLAKTAPVPDDWENDDGEEAESEQGNQRIWDDANTKSPNPMPAVIISPSSTSSHQVLSPPLEVFQPIMRILKRPSNSSFKSATPPPSSMSLQSLKEREVRYQAARERIFGEGSLDGNSSSQSLEDQKATRLKNTLNPSVVRNPRGPTEGSD